LLYNFRFAVALREICSVRSQLMAEMAINLPITPAQLADSLAVNKPDFWKARGHPPTHAALLTISSIIEKSNHEYVAQGVAEYLLAALGSHAVRHAGDAELIAKLIDPDKGSENAARAEKIAEALGWTK
jgi:hypothetical protein